MSKDDFYQEIEHIPVPWGDYELHVPVFYPKITLMTISVIASLEKIRNLLPSTRLKPYRITPWQSTLSITTYQYQESDLGPYNEVSIAIPVTVDEETPLFTGVFRKLPRILTSYTHHLPVTTEIARVVGAEFAGYPKFVADIEFTDEGNWLTCELTSDGQKVLKLRGRKLSLEKAPRFRVNPLNYRQGYILRSEFVVSEREMGTSQSAEDVKLELGDHIIAEELKALNLGRILSYSYCPQAQGILTPVFESYAG